MKALLGSLMCLLLGAAQTFAISGGPPYPGGGTNIVGRYSGVLQGLFDPTLAGASSQNAIGVFSLGVPRSGLSTGTFIMFARGRVFAGQISGTGDPDQGSLEGILNASYTFDIQRLVTLGGAQFYETVPVTATATGTIRANVLAPRRSGFAIAATRVRGSGSISITGADANGNSVPAPPDIGLSVNGFKQSDSP